MFVSRCLPSALGVACVSLSAFAPATQAAGPASVTVRVEGITETLVVPTAVTTTAAPVVKDGNPEHACPGTTAAGALQLATSGSWGGVWFKGLGYSVETIAGESHKFEEGASANYFWSFWLDNKPATTGVCQAELNPGDSVLLFPECFSETGGCPPPPSPLSIVAPAVAEAGAHVTVTVTSYANASGAPSPAMGATVAGDGASATTDSSGHATLTLPGSGSVVLRASATGTVRVETTICVHSGNDGTCGTERLSGSAQTPASGGTAARAPYTGPYAVAARATGLIDGHVYSRRHAPRLLTGSVFAHTSLAFVGLELRREYKGRCWAYEGTRERFLPARCGHGSFFKVPTSSSFSYLLPSVLARGRYVLDIEATDAAGNHTTLARGSSRIVFYVR
jgi:hypothetical protein